MGSKTTTWTTVIVVIVVLALVFWAMNKAPVDDGSDVIDTTPVVDTTPSVEDTQPAEQPAEKIPATVGATVSLKSAFIAEPSEVTVKVGEAVEFLNEGDVYHVINIDKVDGNIVFESPELKQEGKTSYVFEEAGEYNFYSATFAPLRGKISVE